MPTISDRTFLVEIQFSEKFEYPQLSPCAVSLAPILIFYNIGIYYTHYIFICFRYKYVTMAAGSDGLLDIIAAHNIEIQTSGFTNELL